jgi:major outer membrane protein
MKKVLAFLSPLLAALPLQVQALYQGNPSLPEIIDEGFFLPSDLFMGIKVGYQRDQVFNRNLQTGRTGSHHVSESQQLYNQGVLTLNFMDRVEIFGSAGAMTIDISDRQRTFDGTSKVPYQVEIHSHNEFTWGAGLRADIIDWCNAAFGVSTNFQYAHPHTRWNALQGATVSNFSRVRWLEWQIGIGLSYHIDIFTPYIGVNYSKVNARVRKTNSKAFFLTVPTELLPLPDFIPPSFKMRNYDHFGMVLGCDLSNGKYFDLGVEVRLISEEALTLKGDIKF